MKNKLLYQIYPLGLLGAPFENDGILKHRLLDLLSWIDHFDKLGIQAILFNPIFQSETHGYNTIDFSSVDVRLGTNQDFKHVVDALHQHGIEVILDGVFNHVGRSFPYFQDVLKKKWDSPYCDWFYCDFSNTYNEDGFSYADWEGHHELVKLNLENPEVRQYLLDQVGMWIDDFSIDGLRLDVAYCLNQTFLQELHTYVKQKNPDFFLVGEMISGDYNILLHDQLLDSVTNYECRKGLYSSMNTKNLFEIAHSLQRQFGKDPWCLYTNQHLLSFLDNHDVDRIASIINDERDLPIVYALMYAMPGIPCIYYGSEWCATGKKEHGSDALLRPAFTHPEWNHFTDFIQTLNKIYKQYPQFYDGDYQQLYLTNEQFAFQRQTETGRIVACFNIADHSATIHLPYSIYALNLFTNDTKEIQELDMECKSFCFYYEHF